MRNIAHPLLLFAILWISVDLCSQTLTNDSTFSHYDSIQDNRLEVIRQRTRIRLDRLEENRAALSRTVDSLLEVQDALGDRLFLLEDEHRKLSEQVLRLQRQLDQAVKKSTAYRERLERVLWLAGTLILLLLMSLSLYLFLYSVRIRNFLQRQIGSVRDETMKAVKKVRKRQRSMEKRTRKDLKKRIRTLERKL